MTWFDKVNDDMMWGVEDEEALSAIRELARADSYEKCIVAEGDGHHVIWFEGVVDGDATLLRASVAPDWKTLNSGPERGMAGEVDNVFQFSEDWGDMYVSNELPRALD